MIQRPFITDQVEAQYPFGCVSAKGGGEPLIGAGGVCDRCHGAGTVVVRLDSLLIEDRRFCTRCKAGREGARRMMSLIRKARVAESHSAVE
jgi:hypothetical protein